MGGIVRLKNKQTGEIVNLTLSTNGEDMIIMGNDMLAHITKLSELNDYEDYKEPKEPKEPKKYWFINSGGETVSYYEEDEEPEDTEACKKIGNYFETEEEAEKAVEKLKACRRLKDKGFKFRWIDMQTGQIKYSFYLKDGQKITRKDEDDLLLLFGGEE